MENQNRFTEMDLGRTCGYCGRGGGEGLKHDPSWYRLWVSVGKKRGGIG